MIEGQWYDVGIGGDAKAVWETRGNEIHGWAKFIPPGWTRPIMVHASTDLAAVERAIGKQLEGAAAGGLRSRLRKRFRKVRARIKKVAKKIGKSKVLKGVVRVAKKAINNPIVQAALASNPYGQAFLAATKGIKMIRKARKGVKSARRQVSSLRRSFKRGSPRARQAVRFIRAGLRAQRNLGPLSRAALGAEANSIDAITMLAGMDPGKLDAQWSMGKHNGSVSAAWSGAAPYTTSSPRLMSYGAPSTTSWQAEAGADDMGGAASGDDMIAAAAGAYTGAPMVEIMGDDDQYMLALGGSDLADLPDYKMVSGADDQDYDYLMAASGELAFDGARQALPELAADIGRGRWRRKLRKKLKKVAKKAVDPREHFKTVKRATKHAVKMHDPRYAAKHIKRRAKRAVKMHDPRYAARRFKRGRFSGEDELIEDMLAEGGYDVESGYDGEIGYDAESGVYYEVAGDSYEYVSGGTARSTLERGRAAMAARAMA
jgi:hypothetical protein